MADNDVKKAVGATAITVGAAGAGLGVYEADSDNRQIRKAKKKRQKKRDADKVTRQANIAESTRRVAQQKLEQLEKIQPQDLSAEDRKVRQAYIKEQKNVIKGATKSTAKDLAKSIGLRSIPGLGAFISLFASKPAYARGGKVHRGRTAGQSSEKAR